MRSSDRSPSIVPTGNDQDVYLVLDNFGGRIGQSWRDVCYESVMRSRADVNWVCLRVRG